jgi:Ca2+:H+ antiporter
VIGWIIGRPLGLLFDKMEVGAVFLAIMLVFYAVNDGKSNWLEGFILVATCVWLFILKFLFLN